MTYYILKLVIMLPLMAGMIVGALWLYRKYQPGLAQGARQQDLRLVETLSMGTSGKLAVVEFGDQFTFVLRRQHAVLLAKAFVWMSKGTE